MREVLLKLEPFVCKDFDRRGVGKMALALFEKATDLLARDRDPAPAVVHSVENDDDFNGSLPPVDRLERSDGLWQVVI